MIKHQLSFQAIPMLNLDYTIHVLDTNNNHRIGIWEKLSSE